MVQNFNKFHFKYYESHLKPSAYPIFFDTEHMKTSIGLPSISFIFYTPN